MSGVSRRQALKAVAAGGLGLAMPAIVRANAGSARVVVVGGGFGGAAAARYLKLWAPQVQVTLVEPLQRFYTCPFSNVYLAGLRRWESLGHGFDGLRAAGIEVIHARAEAVDAARRTLTLSTGHTLAWDRLVLSPGVDMRWDASRAMTRPPPSARPMPGRRARRRSCCAASSRRCPTAAPS